MRRATASLKRTVRATRIAATDQRIPRPLRWIASFALLPIPGPIDEAVLLVVFVPLVLFYRQPLREAWARAGDGARPQTPSPSMSSNARKILAVQALRAFAYGAGSVLLGVSLAHAGLSASRVGIVLGALVAGIALASVALGRWGERFGRRRSYVLLLMILTAAGSVFALTSSLPLLVIAALSGAISGDVVESGPFTSLEQAMLANDPAEHRLRLFGTYNIVATLAGSLGALAAGLPGLLARHGDRIISDQHTMLLYPICALVAIPLALGLSPAVEAPRRDTTAPLGLHRSRSIVTRLAALFAVDSFAGGFVVQTYVVYWLSHHFGASTELLGGVFFAVGILQALSFKAAVHLGGRIGLLNTMVSTHLLSNLFLAAIAFAPSLPVAIALLLARFALGQMDVPARQVYVAELVDPEERTAAAAYTNTARYLTRPAGPIAAGALAASGFGAVPFLVAGGVKAVYDLVLYRMFRSVPLPDGGPEREEGGGKDPSSPPPVDPQS